MLRLSVILFRQVIGYFCPHSPHLVTQERRKPRPQLLIEQLDQRINPTIIYSNIQSGVSESPLSYGPVTGTVYDTANIQVDLFPTLDRSTLYTQGAVPNTSPTFAQIVPTTNHSFFFSLAYPSGVNLSASPHVFQIEALANNGDEAIIWSQTFSAPLFANTPNTSALTSTPQPLLAGADLAYKPTAYGSPDLFGNSSYFDSFVERINYPLPQPLAVDFGNMGNFLGADNQFSLGTGSTTAQPITIPQGTTIDSYLIHFDPPPVFTFANATINIPPGQTFVGLITQDGTLDHVMVQPELENRGVRVSD